MDKKNKRMFIFVAFAFAFFVNYSLFASPFGEPLPWEGPLQRIVDSLTGPVLRGVTIIAIVVSGIGFAFGEGGGFFRKTVGVVLGLSIATGAASIAASFFGI